MKVLWFSLSPCASLRRNNDQRVIQGWMISLEDALKKYNDIQLEIAFFASEKEAPFVFDGVKYYPMYRDLFNPSRAFNRVRERYVSLEKKDKSALPVMLDVVKQSHPDIIHIHGTEEAFGLIANYVKDIPIVFSIQGMIAPYKEKYFSGIPQAVAYKYDSLFDRIKGVGIKNQYEAFCYKAERELSYLSQANYIFGRTFWDEKCTFAINPQRKYYVVNEILRPEFYLMQWKGKIANNKIKLVSTVSGGIYKGFEMILKTAYLLKRFSNFDFEWHIAGYSCHNKWVHICEKMTSMKTSECHVVFHGMVDAAQLAELLSASDIYVHCSHIENSPNSVCEAMALGMPVIASYAGGTASLLQHGIEGILVQDGDPYVLAGSICEMFNYPDKAIEYGVNARSRAMVRHAQENVSLELLEGYHAVINDFKNSVK